MFTFDDIRHLLDVKGSHSAAKIPIESMAAHVMMDIVVGISQSFLGFSKRFYSPLWLALESPSCFQAITRLQV